IVVRKERAIIHAVLHWQGGSHTALQVKQRLNVRIPTKPAMHSNLKPATCSDPKPAGVAI
ncbi:MAG TPA: hypothetical protein VK573_06035, partial [Gemmatimonadales bacterium]|nr:hypothetical protein [Gemmatimonadales bacterium]